MICISGSRECDGCQSCIKGEEKKLFCPSCGSRVYYDSRIYVNQDNEIIGCEYCISAEYAEDLEERL